MDVGSRGGVDEGGGRLGGRAVGGQVGRRAGRRVCERAAVGGWWAGEILLS